jgi:hypothetical protein
MQNFAGLKTDSEGYRLPEVGNSVKMVHKD